MLIGGQRSETAHPDIITGTSENFQTEVIEASLERLTLVEFHAGRGVGLESLVEGSDGQCRLVRIDVRRDAVVAEQLRVQSYPSVMAFLERRFLTGFTGDPGPEFLAAFLADHIGGAEGEGIAELHEAALQALNDGDLAVAAQMFASIIQARPNDADAIAGLARCQLLSGNSARARDVLTMLNEDQADAPAVRSVQAALALAEEAGDAPSAADAENAAAEAPDDPETSFDLARARLRDGRMHDAIEALLSSIAKDRSWRDEAARRMLIRIFDALGPTAPETLAGRRRLSAILFS